MIVKRVLCLYRVSTVGQVDHDDIPMQRIACRDYVATHPDWEIVDEISEKGVSGYKVSTNARDAIIEIKKKAIAREFDILLVFMFDRLGRREDETPFVVQWFVQQGIEVWSTREGEQRFDTHVDKLLNYIRFWQASGESEKTSIRVKTKHLQMIDDGHYRGGSVPYGYDLVHLGRTNKKNQPVRDLVINEDEAAVVREIFRLLTDQGYGTNRVANYLNEQGIKTKRDKTLWRATAVRALIENPIYIGYMHMGDKLSPRLEHLRILDDATFERCIATVKGRCTKLGDKMTVPARTDTRSLLSGLIFCADCGSRLTFSHNITRKKLSDGSVKEYERDCYRCYRKINARESCAGQSSYNADTINETVLYEVRRIFSTIRQTPEAALLEKAKEKHVSVNEVAYKQAEADYFEAHKQIEALEEQTIKYLTGENIVDIDIINSMMPKYREKLQKAKARMEKAKAKIDTDKNSEKDAEQEIADLLSWAEAFDEANNEAKHMIIARLVERIEIGRNYEIEIKFRISVEQYMQIAA
jgi:DNA invertase Pin-like site-specific DNA recombinase